MSIFESILGCTNKFDDSLFSKKSIYARDSVPKRGEEKDIGLRGGKPKQRENFLPEEERPKRPDSRKAKSGLNANGSADNESGEPPAKRQKKKLAVEKHILSSSPGGANLTVDYSKEAKLEETGDSATNAKKMGKTAEEVTGELSRTVFVGNLPVTIRRKMLKQIFSSCGTVESVRLRSMPLKLDKKLPRRAAILAKRVSSEMGPAKAYVVFADAASIPPALELNMKEVEGHHIQVDRASESSRMGRIEGRKTVYDKSSSIFLGNLPFDVKDEEVIRLFSEDVDGKPSVKAVRIIRDPETNIGKGFGYVLFSDKNAAQMALAKDTVKLRNRPLRITNVTKAKSKPSSLIRYTGPIGAEGRLSKKNASLAGLSTSWQGIRTKGIGKTVKSAAATRAISEIVGPKAKKTKTGSERRKTKRPAVAARKAKALGLALPSTQKKKRGQ